MNEERKYIYMTIDEIKDRLQRIEDRLSVLSELSTKIELICNDNIHNAEKTRNLAHQLSVLLERPSRNWNSFVSAVIAAIVSAVSTIIIRLTTK